MAKVTHVLSIALIPPDAAAAVTLRAAIEEICAADPLLGLTIGPVNDVTLEGADELQLEKAVDLLKRRGLEFRIGSPQVLYKETITKAIEWEHTHKQVDGGRIERVTIRLRLALGLKRSGFKFVTEAGDAVAPDFVSAIEKAIAAACQEGPVAGYPLIDLTCTLIWGIHDNADAGTFERAAHACLREALPKAGPRLLEPVMRVIVLTPQDYIGEVIGDLISRRGQVQGMDSRENLQAITALVPFSNLFGYVSSLKSMTHGTATCTMAFDHYEQVPPTRGGDDGFPSAAALRW